MYVPLRDKRTTCQSKRVCTQQHTPHLQRCTRHTETHPTHGHTHSVTHIPTCAQKPLHLQTHTSGQMPWNAHPQTYTPSRASGPSVPEPNQAGLRSSPRHVRNFLPALQSPNVVRTSSVYGFLFLTDILDLTYCVGLK